MPFDPFSLGAPGRRSCRGHSLAPAGGSSPAFYAVASRPKGLGTDERRVFFGNHGLLLMGRAEKARKGPSQGHRPKNIVPRTPFPRAEVSRNMKHSRRSQPTWAFLCWGSVLFAALGACTRQGPTEEPQAPAQEETSADPEEPVARPKPNEDGSDLWLRYTPLADESLRDEYSRTFSYLLREGSSPTLELAREELQRGLSRMLGGKLPIQEEMASKGALVVGTPESSPLIASLPLSKELTGLGDGYLIRTAEIDGQQAVVVASETEVGALYGAFALLRQVQTQAPLYTLHQRSAPRVQRRVLNHWDNLDRSVERGYAGRSLWEWDKLPEEISPRYRQYARANASIGINGAVLTNVNADARVLTSKYLKKVAAIAEVLRPYGIRVYLTARFSAPMEIGDLETADPRKKKVKRFWKRKARQIYETIPDFGGFLVKANSEGQPGPQDYDRTHAEGANMLARAVAPFGGIVMWRAFVYKDEVPVDRIKQAYEEFKPLDGQFEENAVVQVKNGPLDFQPREPFHPLFGAMPETPLALELQITKEYLGQDTHLAYLGPLYEEVLDADTFARGPGSTVASVIDGCLYGGKHTAMAGVANVGTDRNWTGSHFNQANWYVFGRMAWDPYIGAREVAEEWVRMTFSADPKATDRIVEMMMKSREALVNYMTPLGLVHIMAEGHHYGPGPWVDDLGRADWTSVYYHRADREGLGFDRTKSGSNAVAQYFPPVQQKFSSREEVPEKYLLFFHHVGWDEKLRSGRSLWEELVHRYSRGVRQVGEMRKTWASLRKEIDAQRHREVAEFLAIQEKEARWWRDAALAYFQQFSGKEIPAGYEPPKHPLEFYLKLDCPPDPNKPRCPPVMGEN